MIILILKNKSSYIKIEILGLKYYHKTKNNLEHKLHQSNRPLKRSFMRMNLWQNEFVTNAMSRASQ